MKKSKHQIKEINCEEAVSRFNDFIDMYLKGKAKDELQHHVNSCRHCFERIEFEKLLKSKVASLTAVNAVEEKSAKRSIENVLSKIFGT